MRSDDAVCSVVVAGVVSHRRARFFDRLTAFDFVTKPFVRGERNKRMAKGVNLALMVVCILLLFSSCFSLQQQKQRNNLLVNRAWSCGLTFCEKNESFGLMACHDPC